MNEGGDDVKNTLSVLGLEALTGVVCADALDGSSSSRVVSIHFIAKTGSRQVIESEYASYRFIAEKLGSEVDNILPKTILVSRSTQDDIVLAIAPVHGRSLEKTILDGDIVVADRMVEHALNHLDVLHRTENSPSPAHLREFVVELTDALDVNLRLAGLEPIGLDGVNRPEFWDSGKVSLAHRDLSAVNIIGDSTGVKFIDPRRVVPQGSVGQGGFASPVIDLVALAVSLERKEAELQRAYPGRQLQSRNAVDHRVTRALVDGLCSKDLLELVVAVVRSAYAACRCSYCLAPERKWLYERMLETTKASVAKLRS